MSALHLVPLLLLAAMASPPARATHADALIPAASLAPDSSVYMVYYWRARPGRAAEYSEYIRTVAEAIDEAARQAGVFEEVHTYTQAIVTGAPGSDWTHMRVFRLRNFAALDGFSAGLDAAGRRVVPDAAVRSANSARSAEMRDLVRQEIWRNF
ncbi:MAG: hypothetical protein Q8N53_12335 [Longimicrobiales bacterium]|nr:hypothetical protein [Longimicrobiales bacterium]